MRNPYAAAAFRVTHARRRVEGFDPMPMLVIAVAAAAVPLARGSLYRWVDGPALAFQLGFPGLVARVGLGLAALLCLTTYDALVRGPDRGVVDLHPLLPVPYLSARLAAIFRERAWWLLVAFTFLVPVWRHTDALVFGAVALTGAWVAGIGVGAGVNLAASGVAADAAWAPLLDAVRGENPRVQAAFLWAPGVALALAGVGTVVSTVGLGGLLSGVNVGSALLLVTPYAAGIGGVVLAFRSTAAMARIPAVLADIEATWATAEAAGDSSAVYLEWLVPRVPQALRAEFLKELRHGWRGLRPWLTGAWPLGFVGAAAGWTSDISGSARLAWVGTAGLAVVGFVGSRLAAEDPAWLDALFPRAGRAQARTLAIFAWMQPVIWPGVLAIALRQHTLLPAVVLGGSAALLAAAGSALRPRYYVPTAVAAAASAGWLL